MKEKEEYDRLTKKDLADLNYTGDWALDKGRFTREYERNLEALNNFEEW